MEFPIIKNEQGVDQQITHGNFIKLLESTDRGVRKRTFEGLYTTYRSLRNTIASCLNGFMKGQCFTATSRKFPSTLASSLHNDNVPVQVYDSLIEAVHQSLPVFYEYVHLRRTCLGLDVLDMYDQYVHLIPDFKLEVSFEQGSEWIREALKPLGPAYMSVVNQALTQRWIDVYENKGKRSGGYSGGCYDSPPYILINFVNTLDSVFVLVHEMGHSMHSYLSNKTQPHIYAEYKIFVAEVASTVNELLLFAYLTRVSTDKKLLAYLLNHRCDDFKGTVFRQTMFAEFEKMMAAKVEAGTPLTSDVLSDEYFELNKKYYGPEVKPHDLIRYEWCRIPHFYYNFYVYKYATSLCAAEKIASAIMEGVPGFVDKYLAFLSAGCSKDPIDLLADLGIDMRTPKVIVEAIANFRATTQKLSAILAPASP
eukprot:TRINITY_DN1098_c0_g1_i1.p1 TRINITY_DN1098_c0_g1~~TRINITY_DN1098_c0_g1_i1.p1  ORF type:complete len:471 (+),score=141.42 TRINITY_DN1098_c0_g1_i1:147-1415(+)